MTDTKGDKGPTSGTIQAIAGLSAGLSSGFVGHPFEIVKTRMQIDQNKSSFATYIAMGHKILKSSNPISTLYRGLSPNLVGNACSWTSFFVVKSRTEEVLATLKANPTFTSSPKVDLTPTDYFISATVAGALTQILTNPIWVIKTRMVSTDKSAPEAFPNMRAGIAQVFRKEGFRGFYTGLSMSLIGVSQGALQFAIYDPIKNYYLARQRGAGHDIPRGDLGKEKLDFTTTVLLSTISKIISQAIVYPYQVIRARLQNHNAAERFGVGVRGVVRGIWKEAGIRGFYKGLGVASVRMLPATWTMFLVYENAKYFLPRYLSGDQGKGERDL